MLDPWLLAGIVLERTEQISPLVAVQPAYMHPYSVAKMVTSLSFLHGRRMSLNLVAGGFRNDLIAMGDETPYDDRPGSPGNGAWARRDGPGGVRRRVEVLRALGSPICHPRQAGF